MKFLTKRKDSAIFAEKMVYVTGNKHNNRKLRNMLLKEQKGFCAYTEKYVDGIDSVEVEHFDRTKKDKGDNYFNYYAVLRDANLRKIGKEKKYRGASFFSSLFFQDEKELKRRIRYVPGEAVYEEIQADDIEAEELIDFLGLNDSSLVSERRKHVQMLRGLYEDAKEKQLEFITKNRKLWSFITAVEQ